jgi:tocopherol O-methyltransferase
MQGFAFRRPHGLAAVAAFGGSAARRLTPAAIRGPPCGPDAARRHKRPRSRIAAPIEPGGPERRMITPKVAQTTASVALHYDQLDVFYREIWGDHVHHGYWARGDETPEHAVEALTELVAERLNLSACMAVCDIGCGYGASARYLAASRGVAVTGVTVSAAQVARAAALARPGVSIELRDWMSNGFPPASFDRAYAIESSEHMPDKQRFFDEAFRVLRPGGALCVCAWLARPQAADWEIRHLLEPICREGRLPAMGTEAEYRQSAERAGFAVERVDDLSERVARTWWLCLRRGAGKVLSDRRYRQFLLDGAATERIFAVTMVRLLLAYRVGAMRYELLVLRKMDGVHAV